MKIASLLAASTALTLAAAAAPAHAYTARKIHTVEGEWPAVAPRCYERLADVTVAYPDEDGKVDRYGGSYTVVLDPALEAVMRAVPSDERSAHGRIRLQRADGERAWHVVSFRPER
jgi:hypothetical protein